MTGKRKRKAPMCMVCQRVPGTVERGKARYCGPCAADDPVAMDAGTAAVAEREERDRKRTMARVYASTKGGGAAGRAGGQSAVGPDA